MSQANNHEQRPSAAAPAPQRVSLYNNYISMAGFFIAGLALLLLLTFALFSVVAPARNPYVDIIGYLILPGGFVFGLLIVPVGILFKRRQLRRRAPGLVGSLRFPRLDLNDRWTRRAAAFVLLSTFFVVLPTVGVSSYFGYHYTESSYFCGQVCHSVMEPQATAYASSSHARVSCAECHIGAGASWFVKSKLSGTRQVLAVWMNSYARPIPPAITELRPARETCEECHWPAKFFGSQLRTTTFHVPDDDNTRRPVRLLIKTGGADETIGRVEGIHMHMALSARVEYVALDPGLQEIPWVRYVRASGAEDIYRSDGQPSDAPRPVGVVRTIDCMDCHNRAAHHFRSPQKAMDLYLDAGRIDATLPFIKREAVALLAAEYPDASAAAAAIQDGLTTFYQEHYPDVATKRRAALEQASAAVADIYGRNFFPRMRVDWRTYPDNVGHLESPGCMRCHDGRHFNRHGQAISSACEVCHTAINPLEDPPGAFVEGRFRHSLNMVPHDNLRCDQCHSGGPLPLCRDCHTTGQWLDERGLDRFRQTPD